MKRIRRFSIFSFCCDRLTSVVGQQLFKSNLPPKKISNSTNQLLQTKLNKSIAANQAHKSLVP
jgi:hypothetical protein